jgi:DNA (cytosine-5)-methyltransferase 1
LRFDKHYYSEVDEYATKIYRQRFPDAIPLGDITKIDVKALVADTDRRSKKYSLQTGRIQSSDGRWLITGGFPCQDISVAGKGTGLEGRRSGLWFEMWRIIRDLRPRWVIAENVGAITFRGLSAVVNSLAQIGYDCEWQDIRASDVGAPHKRERIWIVAYPGGLECRAWTEEQKTLREVQANGTEHDNADGPGTARKDVADSETVLLQGCNNGSRQEQFRRSGWWTTEPDVGRVAHGIPSKME